jgi:hypothetical protein
MVVGENLPSAEGLGFQDRGDGSSQSAVERSLAAGVSEQA